MEINNLVTVTYKQDPRSKLPEVGDEVSISQGVYNWNPRKIKVINILSVEYDPRTDWVEITIEGEIIEGSNISIKMKQPPHE